MTELEDGDDVFLRTDDKIYLQCTRTHENKQGTVSSIYYRQKFRIWSMFEKDVGSKRAVRSIGTENRYRSNRKCRFGNWVVGG